MAAGVGLVLPGDHQHPPAVTAYGGDGLHGAVEGGRGVDGVVDVQLAEPVDERLHRLGRQVGSSSTCSGGPRRAATSSTGSSTPSSSPRAVSVLATPGAVSISVMSRSKATTSMPSIVGKAGDESDRLPRVGGLCHNGRLTSTALPICSPGAGQHRGRVRPRGDVDGGHLPAAVSAVDEHDRRHHRPLPRHARRAGHGRQRRAPGRRRTFRAAARADQDATLAAVGAGCSGLPMDHRAQRLRRPAHRRPGRRSLAAHPRWSAVEPDTVRRLAAAPAGAGPGPGRPAASGRRRAW